MKKLIAIMMLAVMLLSVLTLTACGGGGGSDEDLSNSKYVGSWKATTLALGDETGTLDDEAILTVKGDGTGVFSADGEDSSFTWHLIDGGFKTKGDVKLTFKDDGDNIKTTILGADMIFERQ